MGVFSGKERKLIGGMMVFGDPQKLRDELPSLVV